ncbi:hypothetical protein EK69_004349 [Salmonella enterica subsp. enterica]|nr:hypothetical protein [Salmonella enterica subsp. enterica serovar Volkmarsdorf]EDW1644073.1 hypothetical protein [Salmonella enterica subsp. enterica serovar Baguida]
MAMTNAERQARYRRSTRERRENYTSRLNTEILCGVKLALKRLSLHHGLSQRDMLEQIITQADNTLRQSLDVKARDSYLDLTLEPLRSNKKRSVTQ